MHSDLFIAMIELGPVYLFCLVIGGGFLVITSLLGVGGDGADAGEMDLDSAGGAGEAYDTHHAHGSGALGWLSLRFVIYFLAGFGTVGVILAYVTGSSQAVSLPAALAGGVVCGAVMQYTLRAITRTAGDGTPKAADFLDKPSRVTVGIARKRIGEVAVAVRGAEQFIAATAKRPDDEFKIGDRVVIKSFSQGRAEVVSLAEHEFLTQTSQGDRA